MSAMDDEFDTMATWTADVAADLGPEFFEPAGCRGSGGPRTLNALLDRMDLSPGARLLDVGAGVGGPAGYAVRTRGVAPLLLEPEPGGCRAARRLFDLPTVRASATALPIANGVADAVWSLGVLCSVPDQVTVLRELRRVVVPGGTIGMLIFEAQGELPEQPEGNSFPTADVLLADLAAADLHIAWRGEMTPTSDEPADWRRRSDAVDEQLQRRHGDDEAYRTAEEQSGSIGRLLADGHLVGRLLTLRG